VAKIVPKANGTVHLTDRIVFNLSSVSVAEPHRTLQWAFDEPRLPSARYGIVSNRENRVTAVVQRAWPC
jgi:hypothetical protein